MNAGEGELVQILVIAAGIVLGLVIASLLHVHITTP